jgi:hypothetical protein
MSRLRSPLVLAISLLSLAASLTVAAAPAAAASQPTAKTPSDTLLSSNQVKVTSSTGKTLFLSVFVDRFTEEAPVSTSLQIGIGDNAGESHDWELNVAKRSFTYDMTSHRGMVHTGPSQIAPLGVVSLAIVPRGAGTSRTCAGGNSWVKQPVTIAGTIVFTTHSRSWGRVGSRDHQLTFKGRSQVETDYGNLESSCFGGGATACAGGIGWQNAGSDHGLFDGESFRQHGKLRGFLDFTTGHSLPKPDGAFRDDDADIGTTAPRIIVGPKGARTVIVRAGRHGVLTGSATLASIGAAKTITTGCRGGSTKVWNASYTPGANPLSVHLDIGGTFSQGAQKTGASISHDSG